MAKIIIYSKPNCPYCDWAKQLLDAKKATYSEVRIDLDDDKRAEMERLSGRRTVPQIFINDQPIGGFDDLSALAEIWRTGQVIEVTYSTTLLKHTIKKRT